MTVESFCQTIVQVTGQQVYLFALTGTSLQPVLGLVHLLQVFGVGGNAESESLVSLGEVLQGLGTVLRCIGLIEGLEGKGVSLHGSLVVGDVFHHVIFGEVGSDLLSECLVCFLAVAQIVQAHVVQTHPVGTSLGDVEANLQSAVGRDGITIEGLLHINLGGGHCGTAVAGIKVGTGSGVAECKCIEVIDTRGKSLWGSAYLAGREGTGVPVFIVVARNAVVLGIVAVVSPLVLCTGGGGPSRGAVAEIGGYAQHGEYLHRVLHGGKVEACQLDGFVQVGTCLVQLLLRAARVVIDGLGRRDGLCAGTLRGLGLFEGGSQLHGGIVLLTLHHVVLVVLGGDEDPVCQAVVEDIVLTGGVSEVQTGVLAFGYDSEQGLQFVLPVLVLRGEPYLIDMVSLVGEGELVVYLAVLGVIHINFVQIIGLDEHIAPLVGHPSSQHIVGEVVGAFGGSLFNLHLVSQRGTHTGTRAIVVGSHQEALGFHIVEVALLAYLHGLSL